MRIWLPALLVCAAAWLLPALGEGVPRPGTAPTVILVDKKTNKLFVAEYEEDEYDIFKTYPATIGEVDGDKEEEGDLKTPEGIYTFKARLTPPTLKPKFGVMAFYMDYPNPFDVLAGRTGFDIMLHATDDPTRLRRTNDSEGCIVVKNEQLQEIKPYIRVGLTPILVFDELTMDYRRPTADRVLQSFFHSWIAAWETKDLDRYMDHYHSRYINGGRDWRQYKDYKRALNAKYETIEVNPRNVQYYRHPKYSMILFEQEYKSKFPGGKLAFVSKGTKIVYVAEESGRMKIISEDYLESTW